MNVNVSQMYHIELTQKQGARYAILPGDPGRVEAIASLLEQPEYVHSNREFTTWSGSLEGERVLVTSTGIGGPSAAIAAEELFKIGVHTILRVGTCGGMQPEVQAGELVIPSGAVRMDGTSKEYIPIEYPAVPNFDVLSAIVQAAKNASRTVHVGVIQSKDSFYGQHAPESMPDYEKLEYQWKAWLRAGVLASEMETATLFTVAAARGMRAGALMLAVWNQERERQGLSNCRVTDTSLAVRVAVDAMRRLIQMDQQTIY